jgi:anti-sigma factor RsiW
MINERDDQTAIDELLPWHATGRLSAADQGRVEAALARDPEVARRATLAREEMEETISLNETLGVPSSRARDALFARIDALGPQAKPAGPGLMSRLGGLLNVLSPKALAWSAVAAALLIMVQAGILGSLMVGQQLPGFEIASGPAAGTGSRVLVTFAPEATAGQIASVLQSRRAVIVDGPRPGGDFVVRVSEAPLADAEMQQAIAALRQQSAVIRFVAPSP